MFPYILRDCTPKRHIRQGKNDDAEKAGEAL